MKTEKDKSKFRKEARKILDKRYWMIVSKNKNVIILHLNEDLFQYKKFKKVNKKLLNKLIKTAK